MPNYNRIELVGHLTRDVETRSSQAGTKWSNFNIAVNFKPGRDAEPEVIFWAVKCFKYPATQVEGGKKGDAVWIEGTVQKERWNDKKTGEEREKLVVLANNAFILDHVVWQKGDDDDDTPVTSKRPAVGDDEDAPF